MLAAPRAGKAPARPFDLGSASESESTYDAEESSLESAAIGGDITARRHTKKKLSWNEAQSDEEDITHVAQWSKDPSSYSSYQPIWVKDAFNFFPLLPFELVLEIFKYLALHDVAQAAQVSKLWRTAAYDPSLYAHLSLYPYRRTLDDVALGDLVARSDRIETFNATYCLNSDQLESIIELLVSRCSHTLTTLDVTDCPQFTDRGLGPLTACYRLRSLILTGTKVTAPALLKFAETASCRQLESLHVSSIKGIKEKDVLVIKQLFPSAKVVWRIGGAKILFYMEPFSYSTLVPLQYSKLSCKTGLRLRSFYRYIMLKLKLSGESKYAEDVIEITYQNMVLSPAVTLEEAVGASLGGTWPEDKTVTLRYRRRGESETRVAHPLDDLKKGKPKKEEQPAGPKKKEKPRKEPIYHPKEAREACDVM